MSQVERKLKELGLSLPAVAKPVANYLPYVRAGNLLIVSGQLCTGSDGKLSREHQGKVGSNVSAEAGHAAARLCALNVLAQVKDAGGDLDADHLRCVRLGGFINSASGFSAVAGVMNGASNLMVAVLGERGAHARSTVGVAELPMDAAVEVEAIFVLR